jgi:hypothetical protein
VIPATRRISTGTTTASPASNEGGLAYKLLAAGASAKPACRESTTAYAVDDDDLDIDAFMRGCLDGMEDHGWG